VRLSRGKRLSDADIDPAGIRLAAVLARDGQKRLAVWPLARSADGTPVLAPVPTLVAGLPGCQYASPRWAPDGARLAAVRQCPGSLPVIVEVEAADGAERVLASGGRNVTPTWAPDGRNVMFASDRDGGRFRLYAVERDTAEAPVIRPRPVLDAPGGVMWPEVDTDGRTVVFASLTADGYDLFAARIPQPTPPAGALLPASAPADGQAAPAMPGEDGSVNGVHQASDAGAYSPWKTLLPRAWTPQFAVNGEDVDIGAATGASDVLGYHQYSAAALWRVSGQAADITFDAPPVNWSVSYAYNRWTPSLMVSAWSTLDTVAVSMGGSSGVLLAQERSRGLFAGVVVPWRRVRLAQSWLAGMDIDQRHLPEAARVADRSRNGVRAGWALNSSREYGYSISAEDGIRMALNLERVTPALGADANAVTFTGDWRGYVGGPWRHHVAAIRLGAASSTGENGMKRVFDLGGNGVSSAPFTLGQRAVGLLRGLPPDERQGPAMLVANLDYRFPLVRVERGIRTWPIFFRDIHGAVFGDAGSAGEAMSTLPAAAWSVGGELAARITLGYSWNLSVAAGAAWVRDPSRPGQQDRAAAFVRTGYAF